MTVALHRACARAVHLVLPEGGVLRAGRASLFVLGQVGWPRLARWLDRPPLRWLVELGYFLVARNRSWLGRLWAALDRRGGD
jgi:hypothetical protein